MDREKERRRELSKRLSTPGSLAAVLAGRAVICIPKTVARRLLREGVMLSALVGVTAQGHSVLMLRADWGGKAVTVVKAKLTWCSPGGCMGMVPEGVE